MSLERTMPQAIPKDAQPTSLAVVEPLERETIKRVVWRLMPLLVLGYFVAYIDRVNVGFAALTMNKALGFSSAVYGFGAGVFFIGYVIAEIPSNLILHRVGARVWIARILFTWGIISGLTAFIWNDWSFYTIRFLLGLAEAGFYPGMILYMTWWFPSYYRSRMLAIFMTAQTVSMIIGAPVSGWLLGFDGVFGLQGWQFLFIVEAVPSIIMCFVIWGLLTDHPRDAKWLRPEQREWLQRRLDAEEAQRESVRRYEMFEALLNPRVWLFTLVYFSYNSANYTVLVFLPQIVKSFGISNQMTGFVTAIPFLCAVAVMLYWSLRSDRSGSRTMYCVVPCLLGAAGLAACSIIGITQPVAMMLAMIVGVIGLQSIAPTFWPLPTAMLSGVAAAGGIALINSVGGLGAFVAPYAFGLIKDATGGSDQLALLVLACAPVVSALVLVALGHDRRLERIPRG
jgi:ACS family tartrate transporter-like MFS transporter